MAKIVGLEHPSNVTLVAGAMQYWLDAQETTDWSPLLLPHVEGRTLVVGTLPVQAFDALQGKASSLDILVRGIPDAANLATALPTAQVWCGDAAGLAGQAGGYETVVCLVDAATVLSLESEPRSWAAVNSDVAALAADGGTILTWIENDLGIHRITQTHNPRTRRSDEDWNPIVTWDETRPRSLDQVRAVHPSADVFFTWASNRPWSLIVRPDAIDEALHVALSAHAAIRPQVGPDPIYLLNAASLAGRLTDYVSGWLVIENPRNRDTDVAAVMASAGEIKQLDPGMQLPGRPALYVFAELAAAEDLAGMRQFLSDWGREFSGDEDGRLTHDPSLGLSAAEILDGHWHFSPFIQRECTIDARWDAIGELTALVRNRAWRAPWPSTFPDARILNHMAVMAGMHTVSTPRAESLIPRRDPVDPWSRLDRQALVSEAERSQEMIATLRSKVAILEGRLKAAEAKNDGPLRPAKALMRRASKLIGRGGNG